MGKMDFSGRQMKYTGSTDGSAPVMQTGGQAGNISGGLGGFGVDKPAGFDPNETTHFVPVGQSGFDIGGQDGFGFGGQNGVDSDGQGSFGIGGQDGFNMDGQSGFGFGGQNGFGMDGQSSFGFGGQNGFGSGGQNSFGFGGQNSFGYGGQNSFGYGGQSGLGFDGQNGFGYGGQNGFAFPEVQTAEKDDLYDSGKRKKGLIVLIVALVLVICSMVMLMLSYFDIIHIPFLTSLTDKLSGEESTTQSENASTTEGTDETLADTASVAETQETATEAPAETTAAETTTQPVTTVKANNPVELSGYLQREVYGDGAVTIYALVLDSAAQMTVDSRQVTVVSVQLNDSTLSVYLTKHITVTGVPSLTDESRKQKKVMLSNCVVTTTSRDQSMSSFEYRGTFFNIDIQDDKTQGYKLNVRATPDIKGDIITMLPDGTQVCICAQCGEWTLVEYDNGRNGWINTDMSGISANLYR